METATVTKTESIEQQVTRLAGEVARLKNAAPLTVDETVRIQSAGLRRGIDDRRRELAELSGPEKEARAAAGRDGDKLTATRARHAKELQEVWVAARASRQALEFVLEAQQRVRKEIAKLERELFQVAGPAAFRAGQAS